MGRIAALLLVAPSLAAFAPAPTFEVEVAGIRNAKGVIHACLTREPAFFPDCKKDPAALKQSIPATAHRFEFSGIPPGHYALAIFHDENSNQRLDTFLGIPREGFGFSRNPAIRMGPPRFDSAVIELGSAFTRTKVRMQYML